MVACVWGFASGDGFDEMFDKGHRTRGWNGRWVKIMFESDRTVW